MGLNKTTGYYDLSEILGYNADFSIILSGRGIGKTYAIKWFLLKQPGTFMCIYRQKPDMQHAVSTWIDQFIEGDDEPGHEPINQELFEWKGNDQVGYELYYCGELKGHFVTLTMTNQIKQQKVEDECAWAFWDEAIPLVYKKLAGIASEGDALRTILATIQHDRIKTREEKGLKPLRCIITANPFTFNNPILSYFRIDPTKGYGCHRAGPGVVWELVEPVKRKKKGKKMTVDEFLGEDVVRTEGWMDEMAFVQSIPKGAVPWMSVRLYDAYFTLYNANHCVFAKPMKEHNEKVEMYGTLKGLTNKEICLNKSHMLDIFKKWIMNGTMRYVDINTKFDFINRVNDVGRK